MGLEFASAVWGCVGGDGRLTASPPQGLFLLIIVPTLGLWHLIKGIAERSRRRIMLSILVPLAFVTIVGSVIYASIKESYAHRWGNLVSPADVKFQRLPPSAKEISFWKDGIVYISELTIPEEDLRNLFPKFTFIEISEPIMAHPNDFTRPETVDNQLSKPTKEVTNGIWFKTEQANGGGYTIVYDRSQARAYYRRATR